MKIDRALELLKIERECVTRQSPCNEKSKLCDRNCGECDLAQNDLELIEMYDFVISMIETLIGRSQWISVKDRLPVIDEDVLILYESKVSRKTGYAITCMKDSFYFGSTPIPYQTPQWNEPWQYFRENNVITHWMPLPKAPEVKQDD